LQELHLEYLFPASNPPSLAILEASTLTRWFTVLLKRLFDIPFLIVLFLLLDEGLLK
jgi:hypothetical protein